MATERTTMWAPEHPAGSELKGGGFRGGPKRWTGKGPRPARHVPWPEIFKHHLSVVEGHQKMIDMVRKHTVEGTGNWRTISDMLERCHEMLAMTKKASRDFVPPPNLRDSIPIGSSSASMYPGYSPADIKYGEAAQEYGSVASKAKTAGVDVGSGSDGPEYQIGQSKGAGKKRAIHSEPESAAVDDKESKPSASVSTERPVNGECNEYFVVDSFPAQMNGSNKGSTSKSCQHIENGNGMKNQSKKSKTSHASPPPEPAPVVEHEDISEEVDARLKAKEERRKAKKEKKRKRDSQEGTTPLLTTSNEDIEPTNAINGLEKPKKKRSKKSTEDHDTIQEKLDRSKRPQEGDEEGEVRRKKKKQKKDRA